MGNETGQPSGERFNKLEWNVISSNPRATVWENRRDPTQRIEQYNIPAFNQQQVKMQKESYYLRKNHPQIVAALFFNSHDSSEFCSSSYQQDVFIEKIPIRLSDVEHVPYPDYLHIYHQCLYGYSQLSSFFGFFHVEEEFIGINERGIVKVWVSEHYESNYISGRRITEHEMVRCIIEIVHNNLDHIDSNAQLSVRNFLYKNRDRLDFKTAIQELNQYIGMHCNNQIPQRLFCVDEVGIYTIANRQNAGLSSQKVNTQGFISENRVKQSYVSQNSRPRLAQSQIFKQVSHINGPLTPRQQPVTYQRMPDNIVQQRMPQSVVYNQAPPYLYRESSVQGFNHILTPSTVKENVQIVRKISNVQAFKVNRAENLPNFTTSSNNYNSQQTLILNGNNNMVTQSQQAYIPQQQILNHQIRTIQRPLQRPLERPIQRPVMVQTTGNRFIQQPQRNLPQLALKQGNPRYSIIEGIYSQYPNISMQKKQSNKVNIIMQSTSPQAQSVVLINQKSNRNDFIALNRQDNRISSNTHQMFTPLLINNQQNTVKGYAQSIPPVNIQHIPLNQPLFVQSNTVNHQQFTVVQPSMSLQRQNVVNIPSNINRIPERTQESFFISNEIKDNLYQKIPAKAIQSNSSPSSYEYPRETDYLQKNAFSYENEKTNEYTYVPAINSLANKFNAREITSIDVDDGKSSDDFLKKLRQFSYSNNENIQLQQEPSYLKKKQRQDYVFNTNYNDNYNQEDLQYPIGVKYQKEYEYNTDPINYQSSSIQPTYQSNNQFNNKHSYTTSSNESKIQNSHNFNSHLAYIQASEEQLGKSTVSNMVQSGNETPINNINMFQEPLKFQKGLEMKHSIFKSDDIYNKYSQSYNVNFDDDILADINRLKASQMLEKA